jgi:hypothetical protein
VLVQDYRVVQNRSDQGSRAGVVIDGLLSLGPDAVHADLTMTTISVGTRGSVASKVFHSFSELVRKTLSEVPQSIQTGLVVPQSIPINVTGIGGRPVSNIEWIIGMDAHGRSIERLILIRH